MSNTEHWISNVEVRSSNLSSTLILSAMSSRPNGSDRNESRLKGIAREAHALAPRAPQAFKQMDRIPYFDILRFDIQYSIFKFLSHDMHEIN